MAHEAFHACLAYHEHAITAAQFANAVSRLFSWPHWDKLSALILLCGGS
jgi:hypothetical protein